MATGRRSLTRPDGRVIEFLVVGPEDGLREVVLYTDLANPTSNALYQRLGYRPVEDRVVFSFAPVRRRLGFIRERTRGLRPASRR